MYGYQRVSGLEIGWKIGIDIYTLLYIKQITTENLSYSTRNSTLCGDLNGKEIQNRGDMCVYIHTILFDVQQKLT